MLFKIYLNLEYIISIYYIDHIISYKKFNDHLCEIDRIYNAGAFHVVHFDPTTIMVVQFYISFTFCAVLNMFYFTGYNEKYDNIKFYYEFRCNILVVSFTIV